MTSLVLRFFPVSRYILSFWFLFSRYATVPSESNCPWVRGGRVVSPIGRDRRSGVHAPISTYVSIEIAILSKIKGEAISLLPPPSYTIMISHSDFFLRGLVTRHRCIKKEGTLLEHPLVIKISCSFLVRIRFPPQWLFTTTPWNTPLGLNRFGTRSTYDSLCFYVHSLWWRGRFSYVAQRLPSGSNAVQWRLHSSAHKRFLMR